MDNTIFAFSLLVGTNYRKKTGNGILENDTHTTEYSKYSFRY